MGGSSTAQTPTLAPRFARRATPLLACATAVVAILVYLPTLRAPFLYDDDLYVVRNELIGQPRHALRMWVTAYPPQEPERGLFRPTTGTTYALDHLVAGLEPGVFHATNVLLHAATCVLLVVLLRRLGSPPMAAGLAGLLFAVHAVHTEAVSWVVGRAEVLAGLLVLGSTLLWIGYRACGGAARLAGAAMLYFLAVGAKETAAPLPAVLLVGDLLGLVGRRPTAPTTPHRPTVALLAPYATMAGAFGLYLVLRLVALGGRFGVDDASLAFVGQASTTRWATALAGVARAVHLVVVPSPLRIEYGDRLVHTLFAPAALLGVAVGAGLVAVVVLTRRRAPVVSFWTTWFIAFLLPAANLLIEIGAVFAERFLYVASAAPCVLAGGALAHGLDRARPRPVRIATAAALAVAVVGLTTLTLVRNRDWGNAERFWRTALAQSPASEKPHQNLAFLLAERARLDGDAAALAESNELLQRGLALRTEGDVGGGTTDTLLMLFTFANNLRASGAYDRALPIYAQLVDAHRRNPALPEPDAASVYLNYGGTLEELGRTDEAVAAYETARDLRPEWGGPHVNLGNLAGARGDRDAAVAHYRRAVAVEPGLAIAHLNLGITLLQLERVPDALPPLRRARELGAPAADRALATTLRRVLQGQMDRRDAPGAYATLTELSRVAGERPEHAFALGQLAEMQGRPETAVSHYERAVTLDPGHADARAALARLSG